MPDQNPAAELREAARQVRADVAARWNPEVALALADWLEVTAIGYDRICAGIYGPAGASFVAGFEGGELDPAIAVARAYLAEEK